MSVFDQLICQRRRRCPDVMILVQKCLSVSDTVREAQVHDVSLRILVQRSYWLVDEIPETAFPAISSSCLLHPSNHTSAEVL